MNSLLIGTTKIHIEYRRIKLLRLRVYPPDGRACIFAPLHTQDAAIRRFAEAKLPWIEKQKEKFRRNVKVANTLKNNEIHFVWGVAHNLKVEEKPGRAKITQQGGALENRGACALENQGACALENRGAVLKMQVPPATPKAKKQLLLDKWYHRLMQEAAPPLVKKWEKITGIPIRQIFYRKMKTHWGSCNSEKHTIRLNTELAKKTPIYLEYVIIHEMLHILEPSHNRNFYCLMDKYFPDWKTLRRKMNKGE